MLLAAAPLLVGAAGVKGGVTAVPAVETDSPTAETLDAGAFDPPLGATEGAAAVGFVVAGAVPVGVGMLANAVAGAVPDGVRMSEVAVVAAVVAPGTAVVGAAIVGMKKLLEPSPLPV